MEIQVRVKNVLDTQRFVSKKDGSEIVKNTFIGETQGQYPKSIAFTVMGEDKYKAMGIVVGGTYNVSFDVESREWQGKWFTEASAWKALRIDGQQQPQANAKSTSQASQQQNEADAAPATASGSGSADDLPF